MLARIALVRTFGAWGSGGELATVKVQRIQQIQTLKEQSFSSSSLPLLSYAVQEELCPFCDRCGRVRRRDEANSRRCISRSVVDIQAIEPLLRGRSPIRVFARDSRHGDSGSRGRSHASRDFEARRHGSGSRGRSLVRMTKRRRGDSGSRGRSNAHLTKRRHGSGSRDRGDSRSRA
ncbi:hypothetical protein A7U60_g3792 [Sanghuangporus baumii]|uniref:Uncharacterized protein n=1 Tax=Sanghuangporus baumii TaxID=108892 RepID=A0A9Q5I014_SANBA|nr:hypothetical protein A7U60_g3792 [Sanghuangporus baumii]